MVSRAALLKCSGLNEMGSKSQRPHVWKKVGVLDNSDGATEVQRRGNWPEATRRLELQLGLKSRSRASRPGRLRPPAPWPRAGLVGPPGADSPHPQRLGLDTCAWQLSSFVSSLGIRLVALGLSPACLQAPPCSARGLPCGPSGGGGRWSPSPDSSSGGVQGSLQALHQPLAP